MTPRPAPARRYLDEPEQAAYETGWRQTWKRCHAVALFAWKRCHVGK